MQIRLVDLDKEIEQHLLTWKEDPYFKKLPKDLQTKLKQLTTYFQLIRNSDGQLELFTTEDVKNSIDANMKTYLYLFQKKYKEIVQSDNVLNLKGTAYYAMRSMLNTSLIDKGIDLNMYIEWFFCDFLSDKEIQKKFMPPTIQFSLSNGVINRFLYEKKDEIKNKQKRDFLMKNKKELNDILISLFKETQIKEFADMVRNITAGKITISNAVAEAKQLCSVHQKMDYITKIDEIKWNN